MRSLARPFRSPGEDLPSLSQGDALGFYEGPGCQALGAVFSLSFSPLRQPADNLSLFALGLAEQRA